MLVTNFLLLTEFELDNIVKRELGLHICRTELITIVFFIHLTSC